MPETVERKETMTMQAMNVRYEEVDGRLYIRYEPGTCDACGRPIGPLPLAKPYFDDFGDQSAFCLECYSERVEAEQPDKRHA